MSNKNIKRKELLQEYNDKMDKVIIKNLEEFNEISLLIEMAEDEDEFFCLKDELITIHKRLVDSLEAKYMNSRYIKFLSNSLPNNTQQQLL